MPEDDNLNTRRWGLRRSAAANRQRELEERIRGQVLAEHAKNEMLRVARLQRPESGWPELTAGDIYLVDANAFKDSPHLVNAEGKKKFAIVLRRPHETEDTVEVVLADSFKSDREDHVAALEAGAHVAIAAADESSMHKMHQRSLVDCLKEWPLHRSHLGVRRKSIKKRYKGNVGPEYLLAIRAARTLVINDGADLVSFHDAVAARAARMQGEREQPT